jgi:hypothetical protein
VGGLGGLGKVKLKVRLSRCAATRCDRSYRDGIVRTCFRSFLCVYLFVCMDVSLQRIEYDIIYHFGCCAIN